MYFTKQKAYRFTQWMAACLAAVTLASLALGQSVTTTTVQGTVYLGNGQPGTGTAQISWPSFTTAANQAISAGRTSVTIGSDGFLSVNLVPNQGASPAGLFYTVTYYLSDGSTNTEYWVVPSTAQATLAQVRAQVMPSSQAVQTVSKTYVDQAIANISSSGLAPTGGTLTGPLYLSGDPTQSLQAADKHYVDSALSQTLPISGGTFTGPLTGPTIQASVNSVINVMAPPYNAKGDCITDDHAAIQAAINAAQAITPVPGTVFFPKPPGGCYLTSTLTWMGANLEGQPGFSLATNTGGGSTLKGKPGQDILHVPDPNTTTSYPYRSWSIRDLSFLVDDSVDASGSSGAFPDRWPGKWVGDAAMTSGSATLTSTHMLFNCADIGQAILVKGAGAFGADLSTTVSAVSPCYGKVTTATLAASASTTVSAAHAYLAIGNMPVTQQIGNCAIAFDNKDGNRSNWLSGSTHGTLYSSINDLGIGSTSNTLEGQNNSCGIFFQGTWAPYGLDARNVNIGRLTYGVVEGVNDVNPVGATGNNVGIGQDYQLWDHGDWTAKYPWISYNGSDNVLKGLQLYSAVGPQVLTICDTVECGSLSWTIDNAEFEQPGPPVMGYRFDANQSDLRGTSLISTATVGAFAYIDGFSNTCNRCGVRGSLYLGGYLNRMTLNSAASGMLASIDNGYGNSITNTVSTNTYLFQSPTRPIAQNITRGSGPWGHISADFIRSGNAATPYANLEDLLFFPEDVRWSSGVTPVIVKDSTSLSGEYAAMNTTVFTMSFANPANSVLDSYAGNYVIGGTTAGQMNVPATKVTVYASVKCPTLTTFSFQIKAGSTVVANATPACSTSYTTASLTADLSANSGQNFEFQLGSGSGEVDWAYVAVRPFQADYNGYQPLNRAGDTMTGPLLLNADPSSALGAATKQYADKMVPIAGGTMTGPLYLSGDPTTSTQAASKSYVDAHSASVTALQFSNSWSGNPGTAFAANQTVYYSVNIPLGLTAHSVRFRILTADNTANLYDVGLYSISGTTATLFAHTGATPGTTFASGTGVKSISLTSATFLPAGTYLFAITTNCASSCAAMAGAASGLFSAYNSSAGGATTGGVLNSTLTGLSTGSNNDSSSYQGFDLF
ncbi:MAG TPA: glycosyl hydrolase family 28-related protein [Terracidiphilus sp.]|nr:glycosyl hydrolase family 28-related protein [Terracidiphilus sp.]